MTHKRSVQLLQETIFLLQKEKHDNPGPTTDAFCDSEIERHQERIALLEIERRKQTEALKAQLSAAGRALADVARAFAAGNNTLPTPDLADAAIAFAQARADIKKFLDD